MRGDNLFRSELFYRLLVFPVITPPLRERPEDIALLARHLTRKYARELDRTIGSITAANHEGPDELVLAVQCTRVGQFHRLRP